MHAASLTPNTLFRETIRHSAEGERKYIRYYDGRGHFGHVRLRLIPLPGESCRVSVEAACSLPEVCCRAVQDGLMRRFDPQLRGRLQLIGVEARLTGGSYLERHSYPEAYAHAACMAFDEAFRRACPMIVEPYISVLLLVEFHNLVWTMKSLGALLGEMQTTQRVTNVVHLKVDVPVRLLGTIRSMGIRIVNQFPVPSDERYRPLFTGMSDTEIAEDLDEWT